MKRINRLTYIIAAMLTLLLCLITCVLDGGIGVKAYAASSVYTGVLDDLMQDESFKVSDYPAVKNDYSLDIIQIAESSDNELFIYVYQPCGEYKTLYATTARISTATGENKKYSDYKLTLLNANGVFQKYRVDGVTVNGEAVRYYDITAIHRKWDSAIDSPSGNGNTINEVVYEVAQLWEARTENSTVRYSYTDVDTVEIKNPYVDFLSYGESTGWDLIFEVTNWTDIHYIAFSTDKLIDTLKEADVTYKTQSYHYTGKNGAGYTYGDESEPQYLTLTGKEEIGVTGYKQYTWKSIYRATDFIKTVNLTGEAKTEVEKSEFVLVFLKTSFKEQEKWSLMQGHYKEADGTKVSGVSILRLMFETDGKVYNLGAVMNKQEGDEKAGNTTETQENLNWFEKVCLFIWDCIKKLFTGAAGVGQTIVAVLVIACAVAAVVLAIKFIKWVIRGIFK